MTTRGPCHLIPGRHVPQRPMLIPFQWIGLFATLTVFAVMFAIGLMLGREQIAAALQRRVVLAAVVFAVVVPVPVVAVLALKAFALKGPVAVGIVLMAISPGAPVALRRALDAGGNRAFAPALHLAIVMLAVVTVPASRRDPRLDLRRRFHGHAVPYRAPGLLCPAAADGAGRLAARRSPCARGETRSAAGARRQRPAAAARDRGARRPAVDHRRGGLGADDRRRGDDAVRAGDRRGVRVARRRRATRCGRRGGDAQPGAGARDRHRQSRAART